MGNGRCQLSHGRYPADMSQFGLRFAQGNLLLAQLFFRQLSLRDVRYRSYEFKAARLGFPFSFLSAAQVFA